MTSPTDAQASGFTLLEILVVVLLLGLVAGIVLQRGPVRSPALALRATAADLARTLRLARTQAITTNRPVLVRVDLQAHAFATEGRPPHPIPGTFAIRMVATAPGGAPTATPAILFAPDGSSSGGRILLSENATAIEVDTAWLTGRVTLSPLRQDAP